jgi:hypothetical protein
VEIPDSVTSIGDWAFFSCYSLTNIIFKNQVPIDYVYSIFNECASLTSIYVPYGCKQAYIEKWTADGAPEDILSKIVESDREAMMSDLESLKLYEARIAMLEEKLPTNLVNGENKGSLQQVQDQESGVTAGYFNFTNKNPNATALDNSLTGEIKYGATGEFASAFGGKSAAIGKRSHAEGTTTIAKGKYSHAEGDNSVAFGVDSHAEGIQTVSYGGASHAEGSNTQARGAGSHAEGYGSIALGGTSHAEGSSTQAKGESSHSEGHSTTAGGNSSHAEGSATSAIGWAAHAEGNNTYAKKRASHSEGDATIADGECSHAEGNSTKAIGWASHAEGYGTQAIGSASHTTGRSTVANIDCQTVVGRYNDNKNDTLFEVGNGTAEKRSNAFEVYNDGRVKSYVDLSKTQLEDNDLVTVAFMKQYIKDNFATLLEEYFANNQVTFDGGDAGSHEPIAIVGETTLV